MDNDFKKSPFGEGDDWQLNACVGKNGGPHWYITYARGFFKAAERLSETIVADHGIEIDYFIYPLLCLYRHSFELYIKHILNVIDRTQFISGHNLQKLWKRARPHVQKLLKTDRKKDDILLAIDTVVQNFHELDPTGEVFRFPETRDQLLFLQEMRIINIEPVYRKTKVAVDGLELISYFLD